MVDPSYVVVLDTNAFVYQSRLLCTPLGRSLESLVSRTDGCFGLPDVVRREVCRNGTKLIVDSSKKAASALEIFGTLTGRASNFETVSTEKAMQIVENRLEALSRFTLPMPFTFEHANSALDRVIAEEPPNGPKNQQFKDSAIWEAVLEFSKKCPVHFVTGDKGFFQDRDYSKGLADNLLKSAEEVSKEIRVYPEISQCLQGLEAEFRPLFEEVPLVRAVSEWLDRAVEKYGLEHLGSTTTKLGAFDILENKRKAATFDARRAVRVPLSRGEGFSNGFLHVTGECFFDPEEMSVTNLFVHSVSLVDDDDQLHPEMPLSIDYEAS